MLTRLYIFGFLKRFIVYVPIILIFYKNQGLSYTQIQSLGAVYFFSILVFEIPTGMAADIYSYKKSLILSCLCMLVCHLLVAFGASFPVYVVAQVFNGIGYAFFSGCFSALFYETVKSEHGEALYTRKYAVYYNYGIMGSVCAYTLCSILAACCGTIIILYLTCAFSALTFVMSFFLPDSKPASRKTDTDIKKNISRFFSLVSDLRKDKGLFPIVLNGLAVGVLVHLALKFLPFHMKTSGVHESNFGYIETVTLLFSLLTLNYVFKPMEKRSNRVFISISVQVLLILSFLLFGVFFHPVLSVINVVFFQTFHEIFHSLYDIEYNERIGHEMRATFLSAFSFFLSLFYAVLSPLSGIIADSYGLSVIFLIFSVLSLSVFAVCMPKLLNPAVWRVPDIQKQVSREKTV